MFHWLVGCGAYGIYLAPQPLDTGETGLDSATPDVIDCSQVGFFGQQPDYDDAGTVYGRVTSPNGLVGVGGANVEMDDAWVVTQDHGCFVFDLPAGTDLQALELRAWVESGGTLYVSDWEWELFEAVVPEAVDFREDPRIGEAGTLTATILDRNIAAMLGSETASVAFDLPSWAVIDGVDQATPLVQASVDGRQRPLAVSHAVGDGRVIFTSFHNEAQMTEDMQTILYSLILSL
ncbi:MAG: hypothetical protein GY913_31430 [Proteobacteria bacterium]|nr:hypothetical protein [Pseudomonadota bacterium]